MKNKKTHTRFKLTKSTRKHSGVLTAIIFVIFAVGFAFIYNTYLKEDFLSFVRSNLPTPTPVATNTSSPTVSPELVFTPAPTSGTQETEFPVTESDILADNEAKTEAEIEIYESENVPTSDSIDLDTSELPWNLILVNTEIPLPDGFSFEEQAYDDVTVDSRIYENISQMLADASKNGMSLWLASGYRSIDLQQRLIDDSVEEKMEDYNFTQEEALEVTMRTISKSGYSEHHTGLAIDFNYVTYDFEDTEEFDWLQENAENYGFILRYPEDKVDITGYNYEPWHYRYVGVEVAIEMNDLDYCLEEYIAYLYE